MIPPLPPYGLLTLGTALVGVLAALALAPVTERLARRWGAVDEPNEARKVHRRRLTRLGGVALVAGALPGLAIGIWHSGQQYLPMVGWTAGALMVFAIGAVDDCRRLPWWVKLTGITGAAVLAAALGVRISAVRNPLGEGMWFLGGGSWAVTVVWLIVLTNAFNLIDGLDGLAAGLALISGGTLALMALSKGGALLPVAFGVAGLTGAALGFLYYNFNPARMIMGDGGAYFLGFSLGCASVAGAMKTPVALTLAIPMLVFAVPLADTTLAVMRRLLRRQPVMSAPDRGHLHHRLLDLGLSQRQVVLSIYVVSVALCAWAVAIYWQ